MKASKPFLTLIILAYNIEKYLYACMDSVTAQDYPDMEVLCIDDCSTDSSGEILDAYAQKDPRIRVIHKQKNEGMLMGRKTGVREARGDYILFIDGDDLLLPNACNIVAKYLRQDPVSILQFDVEVENFSDKLDMGHILKRMERPYKGKLEGKEIVHCSYYARKISNALWGKAFRSDLCRAVYEELPDIYCNMGEDKFTFFLLSLRADSYRGVRRKIYRYNYGIGVTGGVTAALQKFEQYCKMKTYVDFVRQVLDREPEDPMTEEAYQGYSRWAAEDCCCVFRDRIAEEDRYEAAAMLYDCWKEKAEFGSVVQQKLGMSLESFVRKYITREDDADQTEPAKPAEPEQKRWEPASPAVRVLTFIPRKIYGGVMCIRENGWIYTFDLALKKLKIRKMK